MVVHLGALDPVCCPCGWARRAFADVPDAPASLHQVEIETDARSHDHREHTEIQFSFPSPAIAKLFADLLDPLDRRKAANVRQSGALAALRDALLPKLLSGEIRVGDLVTPVQ